jgi:hypothetical protein
MICRLPQVLDQLLASAQENEAILRDLPADWLGPRLGGAGKPTPVCVNEEGGMPGFAARWRVITQHASNLVHAAEAQRPGALVRPRALSLTYLLPHAHGLLPAAHAHSGFLLRCAACGCAGRRSASAGVSSCSMPAFPYTWPMPIGVAPWHAIAALLATLRGAWHCEVIGCLVAVAHVPLTQELCSKSPLALPLRALPLLLGVALGAQPCSKASSSHNQLPGAAGPLEPRYVCCCAMA